MKEPATAVKFHWSSVAVPVRVSDGTYGWRGGDAVFSTDSEIAKKGREARFAKVDRGAYEQKFCLFVRGAVDRLLGKLSGREYYSAFSLPVILLDEPHEI